MPSNQLKILFSFCLILLGACQRSTLVKDAALIPNSYFESCDKLLFEKSELAASCTTSPKLIRNSVIVLEPAAFYYRYDTIPIIKASVKSVDDPLFKIAVEKRMVETPAENWVLLSSTDSSIQLEKKRSAGKYIDLRKLVIKVHPKHHPSSESQKSNWNEKERMALWQDTIIEHRILRRNGTIRLLQQANMEACADGKYLLNGTWRVCGEKQ